jgi:hypothetical protein
MINIAIIKGINSGYSRKYTISKVNLSSKGEITSIKNNSKARSTIILDYFCFETLSVPMDQEVIDTYDAINMDIKYAFSKKEIAARKNEIDKILSNEKYYPYLFNYWWITNYAGKNGVKFYDCMEYIYESSPRLVKKQKTL